GPRRAAAEPAPLPRPHRASRRARRGPSGRAGGRPRRRDPSGGQRVHVPGGRAQRAARLRRAGQDPGLR
ncbi:MAG: hypothetical protein AVDCRST_MAG16-2033, partial [uncultured Frankineae bacterium]